MKKDSVLYTGVDASKGKHAIAVGESGRDAEVRYLGEIETGQSAVQRFVKKMEGKARRLHFCYEAGPTGYGLYRQIVALGHRCDVVAPSLIPKRPGERVKTNRRDSVSLARLLRAGELTEIWVPDVVHEAVRDLARAREAAATTCAKSVSSCNPSCFAMGAPSPAIRLGAKRTHAGWRIRSLTIRRSKLFSRIMLTRSRTRHSGWAALRRSLSTLRPLGQWRPWSPPIKRCGACPSSSP
jgi:transposase